MKYALVFEGLVAKGRTPPGTPQTAAWAAVDLALLDTFGRTFGEPALSAPGNTLPGGFRYSVVFSATPGPKLVRTGSRQAKLTRTAVKRWCVRLAGFSATNARFVLSSIWRAGCQLRLLSFISYRKTHLCTK